MTALCSVHLWIAWFFLPSLIHETLFSTYCSKGTVLVTRIGLRRTRHGSFFQGANIPKVERKQMHRCSPNVLFSGPRGLCMLHSFCLECPFPPDFLGTSPLSFGTESEVSSFVKSSLMPLPIPALTLHNPLI